MAISLKSIELTFENIDYIIIPVQYFADDYGTHIIINSCSVSENTVSNRKTAESVMFVLKKAANHAAPTFAGDVHVMQYEGAFLFERISKYSDITHIKLIYTDDTFEEYTVAWEEDQTGCRNLLQKSYTTDDGNLKVVIGK